MKTGIVGSTLIKLDEISSTNDYLKQFIKHNKTNNGTVVMTSFQNSGRGQQGNIWESEKGKNLLFSFYIEPENIEAEAQFLLSKAVSLGIFDYLSELNIKVSIKWPNDIYVGEKKIAGILIENTFMGNSWVNSIVGIGLNINQITFSGNVPNPTSIALLTGQEFLIDDCFKRLSEKLDSRLDELINGNSNSIKVDYEKNLFQFGRMARYKSDEGIFEARIEKVENSGKLILRNANNQVLEFWFKEVEFLF